MVTEHFSATWDNNSPSSVWEAKFSLDQHIFHYEDVEVSLESNWVFLCFSASEHTFLLCVRLALCIYWPVSAQKQSWLVVWSAKGLSHRVSLCPTDVHWGMQANQSASQLVTHWVALCANQSAPGKGLCQSSNRLALFIGSVWFSLSWTLYIITQFRWDWK